MTGGWKFFQPLSDRPFDELDGAVVTNSELLRERADGRFRSM
jgi:hypothetical protein